MLAQRGPFSRIPERGITADGAVADWQAAVIANAGTVSAGRLAIVKTFIAAEMAAGTWQLTDDYWPLWGENVPQGLTSLKQCRLAVSVSGPSFTGDRGFTFDGVVNYINTGFIPLTHAVAMTATNGRLAVYERTDVSTNTTSIGSQQNGNANAVLIARTSATAFVRFNMVGGIAFTLTVGTSLGYTAGSRNGNDNTTVFAYKNGVAQTKVVTAPTFLSTSSNVAAFIGANNSGGAAATFRPASIGFACVGAALSAAQEVAQYNNVQAWATSIGANV